MAETPLPRNYFEGTEFKDSINNERRSLLAYIAERGTEGAAAYNHARQLTQKARATSSERAHARGAAVNAPQTLMAKIQDDVDSLNNAYRDALAMSSVGHGREMDRIALGSSAYKDAMVAAQPGLQAAMDAQIEALKLEAAARAAASRGSGSGGLRSGWDPTLPEQSVHEAEKNSPERSVWADIDAGSLDNVPRRQHQGGGGTFSDWYKRNPRAGKGSGRRSRNYIPDMSIRDWRSESGGGTTKW